MNSHGVFSIYTVTRFIIKFCDIYENTIIYNGTINPELSLWLELPWHEPADGPGEEPEGLETPYVNDAGQFSMTFITEDFQAGDEIDFAFNAPESETYRQTIEVQPAQDGMEIVESSADTSDVQNSILEATEFDWDDGGSSISLNIETVGDIDSAPYYTVNDETNTDENRLEHIQGDTFRGYFTPDSLNIGDVITVYIVASGVTTPAEVEVPDSLPSLQDASEEEPVESEDPDDTESEAPEGETEEREDDESDTKDENDVDEAESPEIEGEEEDEGISTGWIIAGIIVGLAVIAGIGFAIFKRN